MDAKQINRVINLIWLGFNDSTIFQSFNDNEYSSQC